MKKWIGGFILLFLLAVTPIHALAVDFEIDQTDIQASLQESGEVEVKETHTYSFDGDFNGITRSLIPKEGTSITDFRAAENGSDLKVEQEDELYKIFRGGEDETVTIDLFYTIEDGVEIYSDAAQFYWPFFDDSNESTYENLTITVVPPEPANIKAAYGEEEAYDTEEINKYGSVTFHLGEVPDGSKGNIRVAYDAAIFAGASSDQEILPAIKEDQADLYAAMLKKAQREERWGNWAPTIFGAFLAVALALTFIAWRKRTETIREARRQESGGSRFPKDSLSLPGMIAFMNHGMLSTEALTSALLDLYRKGNIEKVSDHEFELSSRTTEYEHESILIEWLFDEVGDGQTFSTEDFEAYAKDEENHEKYQEHYRMWQEEVKKEYKQHDLQEKFSGLNWTAIIAALSILPFLVLFPINGQLPWMFFSLILMLFFITFSIVYRPLTVTGHRLKGDLKPLKKGDEWKSWDKDEQLPALLYQIGLGKRDLSMTPASNHDWVIFLVLAGTLNNSFTTVDQEVSAASGSSGGVAGGGTGVGGGGGGSGAF
ncbi:DUF2207 domain-containing protein [Halobacillus campisalis]|uniref:DUF2207 domain-containing protein n=1 Tax=Halobacillus campisalis TaxID=435909 RepID=A0ABW2K072_9BACI|nr:DUF2207 domain-containing protein [Halobacillus campisalis]